MVPPRILRALELYIRPLFNNGVMKMSDFVPRPVISPYDFDIEHDRRGRWTANDRGGLTGGTFLTRQAAMRFALAETGGDRRHVHLVRARRLVGDGR
jgi:hypothetical protein